MKKVFALLIALIICLMPMTVFAAGDQQFKFKVTGSEGAPVYEEPDINRESYGTIPYGETSYAEGISLYTTNKDGAKDYGWNIVFFEDRIGWVIGKAFEAGDKNNVKISLEDTDPESYAMSYEEYLLESTINDIDNIKENAETYFAKHTDKTDKQYYEDYIVVCKNGVNIYSFPAVANLEEAPKILGTIPYETVFQVINWDEALPDGEEYIGNNRFSYYGQELGDPDAVQTIGKVWFYVDYNGIRGWVPSISLENPTNEEVENYWANWSDVDLEDCDLVASLDSYNLTKGNEKDSARNKLLIPCIIGLAVIIAIAVIIIVCKKKKAGKPA